MITNKRRPVHLWHGWFEYISQLESLLAFNACKYVQELTRWSMLCTKKRWIVDLPSLPVGHLLSENCDKTRFVPNLFSLSWKATTCQVRNVQGAFLWTNPRSDFWSKITRICYYHRKKNSENGFFPWQPEFAVCVFQCSFEKVASCICFWRVPTVGMQEDCTSKPSGLLFLRCGKRVQYCHES